MVLRECEGNHNRVQYTMHPIENLSTSPASDLKRQELAGEMESRL